MSDGSARKPLYANRTRERFSITGARSQIRYDTSMARRRRNRRRRLKLSCKWKARPVSVCPRCEGMQKRKTAINEKVGQRYWGDADPFLMLGDVQIHHFICQSCGNLSAYQLYFEVPW